MFFIDTNRVIEPSSLRPESALILLHFDHTISNLHHASTSLLHQIFTHQARIAPPSDPLVFWVLLVRIARCSIEGSCLF